MKKLLLALIGTMFLLSFSTDKARYFTASYYNDKYHGRKTATGERFDQTKLTAASNIYKLGTYVKVTNEVNGKEVIVKVNDRMSPKLSHRIDLSKKAFKNIAPLKQGIIKNVKVEICDSLNKL